MRLMVHTVISVSVEQAQPQIRMPLQGDILEDIELVDSLEETKRTAATIAEQVKAAKESEVHPKLPSKHLRFLYFY